MNLPSNPDNPDLPAEPGNADRPTLVRGTPSAPGISVGQAALYALERRFLADLDVLRPQAGSPTGPLDWQIDARFLQLERLGVDPSAGGAALRAGMRTVLAALHQRLGADPDSGAFVFSLQSDGHTTALRFGVRGAVSDGEPDRALGAAAQAAALSGALNGHLPGSRWRTVAPSAAHAAIAAPLTEWPHLAALSGVPGYKQDDEAGQGLEGLIEALAGQRYQILIIAEPIGDAALSGLVHEARGLGSALHSMAREEQNYSTSTSTQTSWGRSEEHNQSTAESAGTTEGTSAQGALAAAGSGLGMAVALAAMALGAGPAALVAGQLVSEGAAVVSGRRSSSTSSATNTTRNDGEGRSESVGGGTSEAATRGGSREKIDKSVQAAEALLDGMVTRFQAGRALGFWTVGVYLTAPDAATLSAAQAHLRALASGKTSAEEAIRVLSIAGEPLGGAVRESLLALRNPSLRFSDGTAGHPLGAPYQTLGTPINSAELAIWLNLPTREVSGIGTVPVVHFGVNPPAHSPTAGYGSREPLLLGEVLSASGGTGRRFTVAPDQFARHAFITGTTGAGKTNTTLQILRGLVERGIPFLIIEPAKTEYRALLADPAIGPDLQIFTLGSEAVSPFRLNPFAWVEGFGLLTHIDLLKATFNAAFPMYASMPYLLEEAILDVYTLRGWDLASGALRRDAPPAAHADPARALPTLSDLLEQIDRVVERKQYAAQLRMDLSAALKARINSLRVGSKGRMLDSQRSVPIVDLLTRPTILELSDLGDDSEKAFVMGLLLTLLYEQRQVQGSAEGLTHVIVIEEAHRLLKRVAGTENPEIANPQGRAVETFANLLAEVREYGEGVIVIDQIASKLAPDVIKNTNLKIVHRVMARDDRAEVGDAINLDVAQQARLVTLQAGEAVIHADGMDQAVLIRVDHARAALPRGSSIRGPAVRDHMRALGGGLVRTLDDSANWPIAPLHERPGCATCRARCRYGARVRTAANAQDALAHLMQASRQAEIRDEYGNVRLAAIDEALDRLIMPILRADLGDDAHDLKHCVLTHFTDDESVLARHARLAPPDSPTQSVNQ